MADKLNRFQVEMTEAKSAELESFRRAGGLKSKRELLDVAFNFLKWAARKRAQGAAIGSFTEVGGFKELEIPFLDDYAAYLQKQAGTEPEVEAGNRKTHTLVKVASKSTGGEVVTESSKAIGEKRRRTA